MKSCFAKCSVCKRRVALATGYSAVGLSKAEKDVALRVIGWENGVCPECAGGVKPSTREIEHAKERYHLGKLV